MCVCRERERERERSSKMHMVMGAVCAGCMFHSDGGLMSFEHPMNKMKAMPRIDSQGAVCGSNFKVDVYSRVNSIPRTGSEANWADWGSH